MQTNDTLVQMLRERLPSDLKAMAESLAALLTDVASDVVRGDEMVQRLPQSDLQRIAEAMAGQAIDTPNAMIAFGAGGQFGDVRFGDVAGRDLIKINIMTGEVKKLGVFQRPATVYLSSTEPDSPFIDALRLRLALRGVPVAQSQADTGIDHAALETAAVYLVHVSRPRIDNKELFKHHIDTMYAAIKRRALPVLFVREGVALEAVEFCDLAGKGWIDTDSSSTDQVAAQVLDALVHAHQEALIDDGVLKLGFYTSPPRGPAETTALVVDWGSVYQQGYPSPDIWRELLVPALNDMRVSLGRVPMSQIELHAFMRLAPAVALGYTFREPTRTHFRLRQRDDYWHTALHDLSARPLEEKQLATPHSGPEISIELNITQPPGKVSRDVEHYLSTTTLPIGRRVALERPDGMSNQLTEAMAQAIASQVRTTIQTYRQQDCITHLFLAVPFSLALMIGWHLNTLTPVQCYEMPEGATSYEPACRLHTL